MDISWSFLEQIIYFRLEYLHFSELSDEQKRHFWAIFRPKNGQNRKKKLFFLLYFATDPNFPHSNHAFMTFYQVRVACRGYLYTSYAKFRIFYIFTPAPPFDPNFRLSYFSMLGSIIRSDRDQKHICINKNIFVHIFVHNLL